MDYVITSNGQTSGPISNGKHCEEPRNVSNYTNRNKDVTNSKEYITSNYSYTTSEVTEEDGRYVITPQTHNYTFRTSKKVPKLCVLLVGLGGNNGTTLTGALIANKNNIEWMTKKGKQTPNFFGSLTQSTTTKIGHIKETNKEIYLPLKDLLPFVDPKDIYLHGWDISGSNMSDAMRRAEVFDYDLQVRLDPYMKNIVPMPGIYYPEFIAANQELRADNILQGKNKWDHLEKIRQNIKDVKASSNCDKVIVLWTANTERFCKIKPNVHNTGRELIQGIKNSDDEISPSTIFAVASILEGCSFINGSPQNTVVPGVIDLAKENGVFVVGNDFKSGQTKFKTMFTEFLVNAGLKPKSIVSYNHLGNNDGKNLSAEEQFKSKEKSKSLCVDDILHNNTVLFKENEEIDHCVVIKYVPSSGDTKKALDEYTSEIFMGGQNIISTYNMCEDSLLAAPLIIDLVLLTEIFERIEVRAGDEEFSKFDTILDSLGYLLKAPLTKEGLSVINSLTRQRSCIENILKVCAGIPLENNLLLERRLVK
jgi:myo-inositol-1-phosphate synthase